MKVSKVDRLARLHALSEHFDSLMEQTLIGKAVDKLSCRQAWPSVGNEVVRERQIALLSSVRSALDRLTRKARRRRTLHLMRGSAKAAGLVQLQQLLERDFDTFKAMNGVERFLAAVGTRERELAHALSMSSPSMGSPCAFQRCKHAGAGVRRPAVVLEATLP